MGELAHFHEDHVTGTKAMVRSDLQRMVADARARRFEVLVVAFFDRFARNERDAWNYLYALADSGVGVYFCDEDTLVPHHDNWQDRLGGAINAAASYSRRLRKKVTRGLERKWALGAAGRTSCGYRRTADKLSFVPDPEEAPIRALVFELYATERFTEATLADELNRRGHRFDDRLFTRSTVREILENPLVIGTLCRHRGRVDEDVRENAVAPIIPRRSLTSATHPARARRGSRQSGSAPADVRVQRCRSLCNVR
jgi:DNA invertase Pin-like site-specific DNA recombinase